MKKVKVLYFVDRMLTGGIQKFIIENIKAFDKEKIEIDILLLDDGNDYSEEEERLRKIGCNKVYKLNDVWIRYPFDYWKYYKAMKKFFKNHHQYDVVHLHSSSKNYLFLKIAKMYDIPMRIAHSHSTTFQSSNIFKKMFGNCFKRQLRKNANIYCACSIDAATWMFGKKFVDKTIIIHNAIDLKKFTFNVEKRKIIRELYSIEDNMRVFGHVGRFSVSKNHAFLLDIFAEAKKIDDNIKLMLVGVGELQEQIEKKAIELKIDKDIIFVGFKNDVENYMNAMDYFVFPSLFEGLGIVLIEAQANGLKSFTSDEVVPKEAKVTDLLEYISLSQNAKIWAKKILNNSVDREDMINSIKENGYDIVDTAKQLEELYISLNNNEIKGVFNDKG